MGSFLLILFIIFFVIPLIRVVYTVYTVRKRMRDAMRQMYDAGQPKSEQRGQERKGGWSKSGVFRKKIGKDVGEYVKFEEIPATEPVADGNGGGRPTSREPQVTDVDWEDI